MQALKPERKGLVADLLAGLTFAVVNVPQAMGHALLATVNPVLGIYTLMLAVPVGAIFTGSVFMNVSTTSALSVATAAGLAEVPGDQAAEALVALVLLVGILQLVGGLLRLGFLVRFVSNAVMTGFLNGVAVVIILGQLGDLTGYDSLYSNRVAQALDLLLHLDQVNVQATFIGLLTLGTITLLLVSPWRMFAFMIAIVVATVALVVLTIPALATAANFDSVQTVSDIATIPRTLPQITLPFPALIVSMLLPAFSIAIIGLIQGAGVSQSTPNPDGKYPDVSRDFLGQGAANVAASFVNGLPAGGSLSGTALILGAGAKSRWTNLFAGLFVALIVLLAAPLVEQVPMPALAALLIVAGFQSLRVPEAVMTWQTGKVSAVVMAMTFAATLMVPLQYAVLLGIALNILLHTFRQANKVVVTQWQLQPQGFPLEGPPPAQIPGNQITILQVYGSLDFAAAKSFEEMLPDVDDAQRAVVMIGLRGRIEVGSTFITVVQRYAEALQQRGGKLMLVGVSPVVLEQLAKTGMLVRLGAENVFPATAQLGEALNQAVAAATEWLEESD